MDKCDRKLRCATNADFRMKGGALLGRAGPLRRWMVDGGETMGVCGGGLVQRDLMFLSVGIGIHKQYGHGRYMLYYSDQTQFGKSRVTKD